MAQHILVFDLDGTLADTNRDLLPVLNRTIALQGLAPVLREDVGHVFGQGAKAMIEHAFRLQGAEPAPDELSRLFDRFLEDYEANIAVETVLFDHVLDCLNAAQSVGWVLAVCTNKMEHLANKLLVALGIGGRFAAVSGGNTFAFRKPDPRHLLETVEMAGGGPAIMVGDSGTDIVTARAAGLPVVAVDFGYSDRPVYEYGPDRVISSFRDLPAALNAIAVRGAPRTHPSNR